MDSKGKYLNLSPHFFANRFPVLYLFKKMGSHMTDGCKWLITSKINLNVGKYTTHYGLFGILSGS